MRNKSISILALLVTIIAGAAFAPGASARTSSAAEVYYKCADGYAFGTAGDAAHCKKPAWTEAKPPMGCTLGMGLTLDAVAYTDMCAGTNAITGVVSVEPGCYPTDVANGFTKRRVNGRDYCGRLHPQEIMPPSRAVSR